MVAPKGPPAGGAGGPTPSDGSLGGVEDKPLAKAGGIGPPVNMTGGPPPGALASGGTAELPSAVGVEYQPRHEEKISQQHRATSIRPQRSKIPISYLHDLPFYTDPNPSNICFQRQHQGELCPSSHKCANSTHNTLTAVTELMGEMGMGLVAQKDILPDEIIAVFGNAIILQEAKMVNEFAELIQAYNRDHPTQGFQYSILYPMAGDSHPSAVIPDQDRALALTTTISKQLRSALLREKPREGLAHLANHTCCPVHRNAEFQILSIWQMDWEGGPSGGVAAAGDPASEEGDSTRSLVATLRATKRIPQGTPILTCYRNTSSGSTPAQLARERDTLDKMFDCACCRCTGLCGTPGTESLTTATTSQPASKEEGGLKSAGGQKTTQDTAGARTQQGRRPGSVMARTGQEGGVAPASDKPTPPSGRLGPMQLNWKPPTRKGRSPRPSPLGGQPPRQARALVSAGGRRAEFFTPKKLPPPQAQQPPRLSLESLDVRAAVLRDSEPEEFLFTETTYSSQPIQCEDGQP